jgi:hypothetical protein
MSYTANWNVVFGEQPTAAKWTELGANDDALKSWSAFTNGTFPAALLTNASVTPAKQAAHIKHGDLGIAATGTLSVTGLPFQPSFIMFLPYWAVAAAAAANANIGIGCVDSAGSVFSMWSTARNSNGGVAGNSTGNCFTLQSIASGGGSASTEIAATFTSMNSDGFTVNVTTWTSGRGCRYIAFG